MTEDTQQQQTDKKDSAGVWFPPPLIPLIMIGIGWALGRQWPMVLSDWPGWPKLGWLLVAAGAGIIVSGWIQFARARTTIMPHAATSHIMQDGLYSFSRNPLYLAFLLIQGGIGILMNNAWVLLLVAATMAIVRWHVIAREEAYLTRAFGQEYLDYTAKVRRWF